MKIHNNVLSMLKKNDITNYNVIAKFNVAFETRLFFTLFKLYYINFV